MQTNSSSFPSFPLPFFFLSFFFSSLFFSFLSLLSSSLPYATIFFPTSYHCNWFDIGVGHLIPTTLIHGKTNAMCSPCPTCIHSIHVRLEGMTLGPPMCQVSPTLVPHGTAPLCHVSSCDSPKHLKIREISTVSEFKKIRRRT